MNREQLIARMQAIRDGFEALSQAADRVLTDEEQRQVDWYGAEFEHLKGLLAETDQRQRVLDAVRGHDFGDQPAGTVRTEPGAPGTPAQHRKGDPFDPDSLRFSPFEPPERVGRELRTRALQAVDGEKGLPDAARARVAALLERADTEDGQLARRILVTGHPDYRSAFGKMIVGRQLNAAEQAAVERAMSLTPAEGGVAVPFTLDPTVILTSDGSANPLRRISRVESIVTNEWRGVSTAGITAGYAAEAAEAGDNAPAFDDPPPTVLAERAQAFVPFSIEIGQDWQRLSAEIPRLLQEAKDDLEAVKFILGAGAGANEPEGLVAGIGAGSVIETVGNNALADDDIYALDNALGPRFRTRAQWVGNKATYNVIRQLDTAGGSALWVQLGGGLPPTLIGYPVNEASSVATNLAAASKILVLGDFRHYLIVDRVGMSVELIPHLFGANRRPTGQRGLYAIWRNGAKVLVDNAFRVLQVNMP
jgi:HK97 family phage major capsid protein